MPDGTIKIGMWEDGRRTKWCEDDDGTDIKVPESYKN